MKKFAFLFSLVCIITLSSCGNGNKETTTETSQETVNNSNEATLPVYRGEFILLADAAVIKGENFIYGVKIDEKCEELAAKVAPVKKEDFDMVHVVVRGELSKKAEGEEGWDDILTIKEIIAVADTPAAADIKIEDNKED